MAPPPTIVVYDNVYDDSGAIVASATVTCVLDSTVETFSGGLIAARQQTTTTDPAGRWQFNVVANDLLTPANSTYTISIPAIGRSYQIAPQSVNGSPQQSTAGNVIVNAPQTLSPDVIAALITQQDDLIVGGAGGAPTRLPKGASGTLLTIDTGTGHVAWDPAIAGGPYTRQSIAYAASITPNLATAPVVAVGTLTGDITINNPTGVVNNTLYIFIITQDGTGSHAVNWGTKYVNAFAPTQTAGAVTYIPFLSDVSGNLNALSSGSTTSAGVLTVTAGNNVTVTGTAQNPVINAGESGVLIPNTWIAETAPRFPGMSTASSAPLVSGDIYYQAILLVKGTLIQKIGFFSGTTAMSGPQHQWFVLYDKNGNALVATVDDTTTAWSTSTLKSLAVGFLYSAGWNAGASYTVPTTDMYYLGIMVAVSTTLPSLIGGPISAALSGTAPLWAGNDTTHTGLTTPSTAPAIATLTQGSTVAYGLVG